jgi:putative endonuclease
MMDNRTYHIYILTNKNHTVLYTGVTNNLKRRMDEHRQGLGSAFTKRYNANILVYCEQTPSREAAIAREKQIKAGSRQKKLDLIEAMNPAWDDLAEKL